MAYITDTQLAASSGSSLIGYNGGDTDAAARTVESRLRDRVSVHDFGAVGNGTYSPLSSRYATLAAAQADYPFVTSLTQSVDWAGIQAALNAMQPRGGRVHVPAGRYVITDSIGIPSYVSIEGDSSVGTDYGSVIDNQSLPLNAPQFVNQDPIAFVGVSITNLTGNGGTHFLKVNASASCSLNRFDGITTHLQSDTDFEFNRLEVSRFNDCALLSSGSGHRIKVGNFPCNSNTLVNVRMVDGGGAIYIRGGENWLMLGGSIEAGGAADGRAIDIEKGGAYVRSFVFKNVYFEAGSEYLLHTDNDCVGIAFENCHTTGASLGGGGFVPYKFDCGNSIITFDNNDWSVASGAHTVGPANMLLVGCNDGLLGSESNVWSRKAPRSGQVTGKRRTFTDTLASFTALHFSRPSLSSSQANQQILRGTLNVSMTGYTDSGGFPRVLSAKYEVTIYAWQNQPMEVYITPSTVTDTSGGQYSVTFGTSSTANTADIQITATGAHPAGLSQLGYDFDFSEFAYTDGDDIIVSLP